MVVQSSDTGKSELSWILHPECRQACSNGSWIYFYEPTEFLVDGFLKRTAGQGYVGVNADSLTLVGESLSSDQLGFIFPKGSDLVEPINAALAELTAEKKTRNNKQKMKIPDMYAIIFFSHD